MLPFTGMHQIYWYVRLRAYTINTPTRSRLCLLATSESDLCLWNRYLPSYIRRIVTRFVAWLVEALFYRIRSSGFESHQNTIYNIYRYMFFHSSISQAANCSTFCVFLFSRFSEYLFHISNSYMIYDNTFIQVDKKRKFRNKYKRVQKFINLKRSF